MNWLKDKKNLPIVMGLSVVVVLGAVAAVLFGMGILPPRQAEVAAVPAVSTPVAPPPVATPPAARRPPIAKPTLKPAAKPLAKNVARPVVKPITPLTAVKPAVTAKPGTAAADASKTPSPGPLEVASGPDPFKVPNPDDLTTGSQQVAKTSDLPRVPNIMLTNWRPPKPKAPALEQSQTGASASQTARRMAGVLFGDGVYAILETAGKTEAVQAGDTVDGGKVISIEADHLTIKTDDDRMVQVPLSGDSSASGNGGSGGFPGAGAGFPTAGGGGGFTGFPGAGGGFPGSPGAFPGSGGGYGPPITR